MNMQSEMNMKKILVFEKCFQDWTFERLTSCVASHERGELLLSVVMAAVFCESILKDICDHYSVDVQEKEIGPLLKNVKKIRNEHGQKNKNENKCLTNIANCCDDIRRKRNEVVHDSGIDVKDLVDDEEYLYKRVWRIVENYVKTDIAAELKNKREAEELEAAKSRPNFKLNVFVSSITPHTVEQEAFMNSVCKLMVSKGVNPIRFAPSVFDETDPMEQVRSEIERCDAFLTIGLERTHAYYYHDREHSPKMEEGFNRKYTSGWLNLESGMAIAQKKPVFVMLEQGVYGDGIFDKDNKYCHVAALNTPLDPLQSEIEELIDAMIKKVANNA